MADKSKMSSKVQQELILHKIKNDLEYDYQQKISQLQKKTETGPAYRLQTYSMVYSRVTDAIDRLIPVITFLLIGLLLLLGYSSLFSILSSMSYLSWILIIFLIIFFFGRKND